MTLATDSQENTKCELRLDDERNSTCGSVRERNWYAVKSEWMMVDGKV